MASRLVDSDVFSFLFRRHSLASRYRKHLRGHALAVSFMTAAEVYELGFRSVWGPGRFALLDTFLRNYVIIPSSSVLARRWAAVRYERRRQPIGVADPWIAATALRVRLRSRHP